MAYEMKINELRKYRRLSLRALPVAIGFLAALCVTLFVVNLFVPVPTGIASVLVGIAVFSVLGDIVNIMYISWKLRQVELR